MIVLSSGVGAFAIAFLAYDPPDTASRKAGSTTLPSVYGKKVFRAKARFSIKFHEIKAAPQARNIPPISEPSRNVTDPTDAKCPNK